VTATCRAYRGGGTSSCAVWDARLRREVGWIAGGLAEDMEGPLGGWVSPGKGEGLLVCFV
jgi:hypothetical protein